jgi:hypothetical protein
LIKIPLKVFKAIKMLIETKLVSFQERFKFLC